MYFGTSPKFWLGLQDDYYLEEALNKKRAELSKIKKKEDYALDENSLSGKGIWKSMLRFL